MNTRSLIILSFVVAAACSRDTASFSLDICDLSSDCAEDEVCSPRGRCTVSCRTDRDCQTRYGVDSLFCDAAECVTQEEKEANRPTGQPTSQPTDQPTSSPTDDPTPEPTPTGSPTPSVPPTPAGTASPVIAELEVVGAPAYYVAGSRVRFEVTASDPDGDTVSYEWSVSPDVGVITEVEDGIIHHDLVDLPLFFVEQDLTFTVRAFDNAGNSAEQSTSVRAYGNVIVTEFGGGVASYDSGGNYIGDVVAASAFGSNWGIAPLPGGSLVVVDEGRNDDAPRLLEIDQDGNILGVWDNTDVQGDLVMEEPRHAAVFGDGRVIVADEDLHRILEFDARTGNYVGVFYEGDSTDGFEDILVHSATGEIWISESGNGDILRVSADGTLLGRDATIDTTNAAGMTELPGGDVLVADDWEDAFFRFRQNGARAQQFEFAELGSSSLCNDLSVVADLILCARPAGQIDAFDLETGEALGRWDLRVQGRSNHNRNALLYLSPGVLDGTGPVR